MGRIGLRDWGSDLQWSSSQRTSSTQQPLRKSWRMNRLSTLSVLSLVLLPSLSLDSCQGTPLAEPNRVMVVSLGAWSRVEVLIQRQWEIPRPLVLPTEGLLPPWGGLMTYGLVTMGLFHGPGQRRSPGLRRLSSFLRITQTSPHVLDPPNPGQVSRLMCVSTGADLLILCTGKPTYVHPVHR